MIIVDTQYNYFNGKTILRIKEMTYKRKKLYEKFHTLNLLFLFIHTKFASYPLLKKGSY